jgi:hypothetical protein
MRTVVKNLDAWTTGQLLAEVLTRSAGDAPALRLLQGMAEIGGGPAPAFGPQWDDEEDWQRFFL